MNDLLTQGLAAGSPIAFLTQGLIAETRLLVLECLPIGLDFQLFVMDLAIATPSINSIVLEAIDVTVDCSEVVLTETIVNLAESSVTP